MSLRAARERDEDEYVSLEGKQSLMAGIGIERGGRVLFGQNTHLSVRMLQRNVQVYSTSPELISSSGLTAAAAGIKLVLFTSFFLFLRSWLESEFL